MKPLRFSVLRQMARSPAHAKWALEHELRDTPAMRLGRLVHAVFLGESVPTVYYGERRGNAWKDFKEAHAGQDIVTESEFECATAMAVALHSHKEARHLLMGRRERTIFFDFAGRPCRATPDAVSNTLTELKTTSDASPFRFPFTAMRLAYHAQLTWYKDALKLAGLGNPERLAIVAIETRPPFAVCVFMLTPRAEDFGRRLYRTWIEQFLVCERSDEWPGYVEGILDAPEEGLELVAPDGETFDMD